MLNLPLNDLSILSNFQIEYLADKVHIHRWPHDTPIWDESIKKQLDDSINKNSKKKQIIINDKSVKIQNFEFTTLKKIGVSVPFFKDECTMIFQAQFETFFAHVHITIKHENFLDIFNQLISWKNNTF